MLTIFYEEMRCIFTKRIAAIDDGISFFYFEWHLTPMLKFIREFISGGIVFDMLHIPAPFKHERFQSFFSKFFRSPSPAHSRPDNYRIKSARLHRTVKIVSHWLL